MTPPPQQPEQPRDETLAYFNDVQGNPLPRPIEQLSPARTDQVCSLPREKCASEELADLRSENERLNRELTAAEFLIAKVNPAAWDALTARAEKAEAELATARIQNNSNQELAEGLLAAGRRLQSIIVETVFSGFPEGESARITIRQILEMAEEVISPGVSKWGRPDAQAVWKNQYTQLVWHENELAKERTAHAATKKELADAKEMIASVKSTADCREQMIDEAIQEMNKAEQRARVAERNARAGWQPIAQMDRKEMQFVLVTDGDVVRLRLWNPYQARWEPEPPRMGPLTDADDCQLPTHWMPLPTAPKPEDGTGKISNV